MDACPRTSIVVLVHETPVEARAAVESVARHTEQPYELVVVDNGSAAAARDELRQLARGVGAQLVRLEQNVGFSAGSNVGWRAARGQEICLLNSDVVVTERWLTLLRAALHSGPDVGAVGPRSNFARGPQGGIWLDDLSPRGIDEFGRFFNHHDPYRWFEPDWLMGFAILTRRAALEAAGGFDEEIPSFGGEDQDLCERLRAAGWRLICAGDTFVFHSGHRTFDKIGLNRTASRLRRTASGRGGTTDNGGRLVRARNGWVFEVNDGLACHVETASALRLIRGNLPIEDARAEELEGLALGPPIGLCRTDDGATVWLLHRGSRRRVEGDEHRIRRLGGVTIVDRARLEVLPEGPAVAVETAMPPVRQIQQLQPARAVHIRREKLSSWNQVAAEIAQALDEQHGYAVVQLRGTEAVALDDGIWSDARVGGEVARAIRRAVIGADAIGIEMHTQVTTLLEKAFYHLNLYPRVRFDASLLSPRQLEPLVGERRAALVVGSGATVHDDVLGTHLTLEATLEEVAAVDACVATLAARRDHYDVVLVAAGTAGAVVCGRAARDLGAVAIDIREIPGKQPSPLFIIGAERSGTALLQSMLEARRDGSIPLEANLTLPLVEIWHDGEDPRGAMLTALRAQPAWPRLGLEAEELEQRLARSSVNSLGGALEVIGELLPEAHFIHVIRDGRDVVTSVRDLCSGPAAVEDAAVWWSALTLAARQFGSTVPHYVEVPYEQLITQPEQALRLLCRELALESDPIMLEYARAQQRLGSRPSIGAWRHALSPDEQRRFFEVAGDLLQDLGYDPY